MTRTVLIVKGHGEAMIGMILSLATLSAVNTTRTSGDTSTGMGGASGEGTRPPGKDVPPSE